MLLLLLLLVLLLLLLRLRVRLRLRIVTVLSTGLPRPALAGDRSSAREDTRNVAPEGRPSTFMAIRRIRRPALDFVQVLLPLEPAQVRLWVQPW